jgi:hypothetical protein
MKRVTTLTALVLFAGVAFACGSSAAATARATPALDLTGELSLVLPSDPDFYHVNVSTPTPASTGNSE